MFSFGFLGFLYADHMRFDLRHPYYYYRSSTDANIIMASSTQDIYTYTVLPYAKSVLNCDLRMYIHCLPRHNYLCKISFVSLLSQAKAKLRGIGTSASLLLCIKT